MTKFSGSNTNQRSRIFFAKLSNISLEICKKNSQMVLFAFIVHIKGHL